jgi:hypothetical protein
MADYSWIAPATGNIANLFGLNPEAAAKGRAMQSEQEYNAARTANTVADTGLSDYRRRLLEAQAATQAALAGQHNAAAGKYTSEKGGIDLTNTIRGKIGEAYQAYLTAPEEARRKAAGTLGGLMVQLGGNPSQVSDSIRNLESLVNSTSNPELSAQQAKVPAAFGPNATFNAKEREKYQSSRAAASQAEAVAVQQERNKGSIAQSLAKGQTPGQPSKRDLLNEAEAIKIGAGYAQTVPQNGLELNEVQALQLSRAAQAANPNLNPQDAIDKFVRDNPGMIKDGGWFSGNTFNIPPTERAAPAVRAPVANGFKGAPSMSMATDNQQPAVQAPAAPPTTRVVGQVYNTPKGPLKWTGTGWVSP